MAIVVPSIIPSKSTVGEKKLHAILGRLPDDWVVYYEPYLNGDQPDFVVLAPNLGVLVIEDKFWKPGTILSGDRNHITISTADGVVKSVQHPEQQARKYNQKLRDCASSIKYGSYFLHQSGIFKGRLKFPVVHQVTLSNITAKQLNDPSRCLAPIFDPNRTVTRDEMDRWKDLSPDELETVFKKFFSNVWAIPPMTEVEVKALRGLIHPEIFFEDSFSVAKLMESSRPIHDQIEVLKALDLRQENAARSIGEGHRIIYGVAGSGKTVILLTRARLLAERDPNAKILLVCFNKELSLWIRERVKDYPQITALTFHALCKRNGVPFPDPPNEQVLGEALCERLQNGSRDAAAFDSVLIDEAQDFEPNWFSSLLRASKDAENGDLLIVADGAQGLYERSKLSWKALGIKAQGRTHSKRFDLDQNYRNSSEILSLAETFATRSDMDDVDVADSIQAVRVDARRSVRSTGAVPLLFLRKSNQSELEIAVLVVDRLLKGRWNESQMEPLKPKEIAILYTGAKENSPRDDLLKTLPGKIYE